MIRFTGVQDVKADNSDGDDGEEDADPDRGYFVDVKTLSAALLGPPHNRSLARLTQLLDVPTKKIGPSSTAGR